MLVKAISVVEYVDNVKQVLRSELNEPTWYRVVGSVRRATGTYQGSKYATSEYNDDPPYLKVDRYIRFYECKKLLEDKAVLVLPDDIIFD